MFQKRLTWFWMLLTGFTLVIVARLVQIQVVQAQEYQELADRLLTRQPDYIPAPRGTIFDRRGRPLLSDEPTADICIHYGVLAGRGDYLLQVAKALRKRGEYPEAMPLAEIESDLRERLPEMFRRLSELTGVRQAEIIDRAARIRGRVERWRAARQGPVREEQQLLPLLEGLDNETALAVRLELEGYPWLQVMPSSRRVAHDADAVAHLVGRLGAVGPDQLAADPYAGDPLRALTIHQRCGISGIERVADAALRGWRGRILKSYDGQVLERVEPVPGRDVHLTIDLDLQRHILGVLEQAVRNLPSPSGASAVVIDVATREVLALVSYPTYAYEDFSRDYEKLRRDTIRLPLLFRAVQAQYPPGSICKAVALVGGLAEGVVTPETTYQCTGFLLPDKPDRFRCWLYNLSPGATHGPQQAEDAVRNSCNIYFYRLGERLGPERLCEWFGRFGLGRTQGTGLIEETPGIVPTEDWLRQTQGRGYQPADAWNFVIGQGELTCTPLQAANVAATIAAGFWTPVRLAYDATGQALGAAPAAIQPLDERHMKVLRRGMWRVVNDRGTGREACLDFKGYELCGKTGSAQTPPRVVNTRYVCEWPDGRREEVIAPSEEDALAQFDDKPRIVGYRAHERYPALEEGDGLPAHAWFIGYTQPAGTPRGAAPTGGVYAISVVIEFGGSGGHVAAPAAKQIAEYLLHWEPDPRFRGGQRGAR